MSILEVQDLEFPQLMIFFELELHDPQCSNRLSRFNFFLAGHAIVLESRLRTKAGERQAGVP